jgi:hypothetical protein
MNGLLDKQATSRYTTSRIQTLRGILPLGKQTLTFIERWLKAQPVLKTWAFICHASVTVKGLLDMGASTEHVSP